MHCFALNKKVLLLSQYGFALKQYESDNKFHKIRIKYNKTYMP